MQIISKLSDMIGEELGDAEKYARCALEHKEGFPSLAKTFLKLSQEELGHVQLLHAQAVAIIEDYKKVHGDPPANMQAVYDYLHRKNIDKAAEIKVLQSMFDN